jgi:FixJ family two-component response regulator
MPPDPLIAIVDDDEDVREGVDCLVRSLGYDTRLYASAEAFLAAGGAAAHDCLISDVQMPGLSGVQLAGKLTGEGAGIPVILMTAFPDESVRRQAAAAGCSGFLAKPCRGGRLIEALQAALRR